MASVEQTQPLISHLIELRNRLLKAIVSVVVVFIGLIWFANEIYEFVSAPLIERLPEGATMIATDVAPDIISQTLLAIPMCLLFEVGLFFARFYVRRPDADEESEQAEE